MMLLKYEEAIIKSAKDVPRAVPYHINMSLKTCLLFDILYITIAYKHCET